MALKYSVLPITTFDEIISDTDCNAVCSIPELVSLKVGLMAFAKGSCKVTYKSRLNSTSMVSKVFISGDRRKLTRKSYELSINIHRIATYLSYEFARIKPVESPFVKFCDISLLQYCERDGQPYSIQEDELFGPFSKLNNNAGMVSSDEELSNEIVQTFCHWTYSRSNGQLIIVDCQGVFCEFQNAFILTDPAIHCLQLERFGGTNLGELGMKKFFQTHICGKFCNALQLFNPMH